MKGASVLLLVLLLPGCGNRVGDLTVCDGALLDASDQVAFSRAAWARAGPEERGRMVRDLARKHRLVEVAPSAVRDLLGANTCYVHDDDEPCYEVTLGGERQYLAFPVAHSGAYQGEVRAAYLRSDPSAMAGCLYE